MGLVVAVLLAAVAVGRLAGGRLDRLADLGLRARRLLVAALLAQVAGALLAGSGAGRVAHPAGLALSALLVGLFLRANRGLPGAALLAAGLLCNALVVAANGAMPVSLVAATRAGLDDGALQLLADPRHEPATASTRLPLLADVVPVPLPLRPEVVSPGDVLVAAGLAQLVVTGMLGAPRTAVRRRPLRRPGPRG